MAGVFRPNTQRRRPNAVFPHARPRGDDAGAGRQRLLVGWGQQQQPTVKVGSVGFDEARIMAEAYAQVLENAGYTVNRDGIGLGDRKVLLPALESGQIDLQPEYIGSGLGAGVRRHADRRPRGEPDGAPDDPQRQGRRHHRPQLHAGTGPERVRRPQGDGRPVLAHQDERRGRGAGQAQARACDRLPDQPAVCRRPEGRIRHRHVERDPAVGVRHADGPGARRQDHRPRRALLDAAGHPHERLRPAPGRQEDPAGRQHLAAGPQRLPRQGPTRTSFEKLLNDLSAKIDTPTLADLYKQVSVDKKDIKDVVSTWLKAQGLVK